MDGLGAALQTGGGDSDDWLDWLTGDKYTGTDAGAAADRLAAENDAEVIGGPDDTEVNGFPGYWVEVRTRYTVGDTIIPGTENDKAQAHATAVIEPRCDLPADTAPSTEPDPAPSMEPDPAPEPNPGTEEDEDEGGDERPPVELICDGDPVEIDPGDFDPADLPDASLLFSVHLAD
ncbi:hypothetical protein [Streptomyces sp. NPDC046939]|uniref:hypothetical protein n=1 Tax=Streptomyces sp. NPDC046939 TaxID=3155376 RepID=UPI0033D0B206